MYNSTVEIYIWKKINTLKIFHFTFTCKYTYKYSNVLLFYSNVYILSDIRTIKMWNKYEHSTFFKCT